MVGLEHHQSGNQRLWHYKMIKLRTVQNKRRWYQSLSHLRRDRFERHLEDLKAVHQRDPVNQMDLQAVHNVSFQQHQPEHQTCRQVVHTSKPAESICYVCTISCSTTKSVIGLQSAFRTPQQQVRPTTKQDNSQSTITAVPTSHVTDTTQDHSIATPAPQNTASTHDTNQAITAPQQPQQLHQKTTAQHQSIKPSTPQTTPVPGPMPKPGPPPPYPPPHVPPPPKTIGQPVPEFQSSSRGFGMTPATRSSPPP